MTAQDHDGGECCSFFGCVNMEAEPAVVDFRLRMWDNLGGGPEGLRRTSEGPRGAWSALRGSKRLWDVRKITKSSRGLHTGIANRIGN